MNFLGLDLSSTSTGWCLNGTCGVITPKGDLLARAQETRRRVDNLTTAYPDLVVVEAIGTRHVQTAIALATVHALILDRLDFVGTPIVTVPPAVLKKFATGKGNASKSQMVAAAIRRGWDGDGQDDACDAWWLLEAALQHYGLSAVTLPAAHLAALAKIQWPTIGDAAA